MGNHAEAGSREAPAVRATARRRAVAASLAGTVIEYFDFALYAVSATTLAKVFFVGSDPSAALLATFAVFAVPFLFRPLGGVLFGYLGDRAGRRGVLVATVVTMGCASGLIGVLPTYASAGVAAPILLFVLRSLQAISAGGELAGASVFAVEHAHAPRRGLYGSAVGAGVLLGTSLASGVAALVNGLLSAEQMISWGWRLSFLLAVPLTLVALVIRIGLEDTPAFRQVAARKAVVRNPVGAVISRNWRVLVQVAGLGVAYTVGAYFSTAFIFAYLNTYLGRSAGFTSTFTGLVILAGIPCVPLFGHLSDRFGRKKVMGVAFVWYVLLAIPLVYLMDTGSVAVLAIASFAVNLPYVALLGVGTTAFVELFPTEVRYSGAALGINVFALVGGATPYLATLLIEVTGDVHVPAYLLVAAGLISLLVLRTIRETGGSPLLGSAPVDQAVPAVGPSGDGPTTGPERNRL